MLNLPEFESASPERISYQDILTAIVKRFARLAGVPAALDAAQKVPGLTLDADANVLGYDTQDPLGTITRLILQYETIYGTTAQTLAKQATRPIFAVSETGMLSELNLPLSAVTPLRILLVDDHVLFREGLVSLLSVQSDMEVVGEADSVQEAIAIIQAATPDLVLMSMNLPDGSVVETIRAILSQAPQTKIVVLTVQESEGLLFDAIRAGAIGYLAKKAHAIELLASLRGIARGEAGISRATARRLVDEFARLSAGGPSESVTLTLREIEVLRELAKGASNQEIAARLVISENTVKNHVRNLLVKLHLHNRHEAAEYARRRGLVPPRAPSA
jgi:two-component system, NarL family, nitrate/nitrite response regulator NarL